MAEQAYWYVMHTYSGYENKVATDLMTMVENRRIQDLICDVKVPTETVMEDQFDKTGNKIGEKEVQRKIYPGYVFVKMVMNDNTWYIVRNTRGCTGFVGPASKPEPLSEEKSPSSALITALPRPKSIMPWATVSRSLPAQWKVPSVRWKRSISTNARSASRSTCLAAKSRQNLVCTKSNFCKRNLAQIAWQQASNSGRNCA